MTSARPARIPSSLPTSMGRTMALRSGRAQWLTLMLGCAVLLVLPRFLPVFWLHLANGCLLAVIGATALNVLTGNARLVSLGQGAFLGIGAFAAGLLQHSYGVPFPIALAAAAMRKTMNGGRQSHHRRGQRRRRGRSQARSRRPLPRPPPGQRANMPRPSP